MQCPHCGRTYGLSDEQVPQYRGQTITCSGCQQAFTVPNDLGLTATTSEPPAIPQPPMPPTSAPQPTPRGYPPPYPVQYASPVYVQQKANPLAIVSVVCGAAGFVIPLIPGLLGIIFGILGLRKTRDP